MGERIRMVFHKMRIMWKIGAALWIGGMLLIAQQAVAAEVVNKKSTPSTAKSAKAASTGSSKASASDATTSTNKAPSKRATGGTTQETAASAASEPRFISTHGDWNVYRTEDAPALCYTISHPTKSTGTYTKRARPYVIVTQRGAHRYEISLSAGYPFKPDAVTLSIDQDRSYALFTHEDRAWAYDAKADQDIVASMMKYETMEVTGHSLKGTVSHDHYSLRGLSDALKAMQRSCPAATPSKGATKEPKPSDVKKPATKAATAKPASKSSNH